MFIYTSPGIKINIPLFTLGSVYSTVYRLMGPSKQLKQITQIEHNIVKGGKPVGYLQYMHVARALILHAINVKNQEFGLIKSPFFLCI